MKALPALLLALALPAAAEPRTYELDPDHSNVHFEVLHFGTSTLRGRLSALRGSVTLDAAAGRGEVGVRIPTARVDTGLKILDARLRQEDLLASEAHPEAFFVARSFRFEGGQPAELRGEFTLRGVSTGLTLRFACRTDDPRGAEVCGGDFEGSVERSTFGMTFGLPLVADRVRLLVQVEAVRR